MKTVISYTGALLFLSLAACKKDTTVTRAPEVIKNNKVIDKAPPIADTVIVSDHQIVVKNVRWVFPWYAALAVKNIHSYVPVGTPIKVFVQRDNSSIWKEAIPASNDVMSEYDYFIENRKPDGAGMYTYGSLYIFYYGKDTNDTPDVKVQF